MMLGITSFTAVHVLLSLIGIASGLVVLAGLCTAKLMPRWTALFLASTLATSLTGFFFPFHGFTRASGRPLALDFCPRRCGVALFQLVRFGGAVVPEDSCVALTGTDRIGASLCAGPGRRAAVLSPHRRAGRQEIPPGPAIAHARLTQRIKGNTTARAAGV
jgi:hypothetical protein